MALIESRQTSRAVLTSSIITTQPSRIACTKAESTSETWPPEPASGTHSWRKKNSSEDGPGCISTKP